MKRLWEIAKSISLAVWLTAAVILLSLYGAVVMPTHEVFSGMSAGPLFGWMLATPLVYTWWLWAAIALLAVLALNTLFCSIDSLIKKRSGFLLLISPQIIHAGFLFILLAHLLSSIGSYKLSGGIPEDAAVKLPNGVIFRLLDIRADMSPEGFPTDWSARVQYLSSDKTVIKEDTLAPNKPSFYKGIGLYLKDLQLSPSPAALIEASHEPGAPWALAGAILFTIGTVMLVVLKMRQE